MYFSPAKHFSLPESIQSIYSVQIFSRSSAGSACISSSVSMFIHLLVCFSNCLVKEDSLHLVGSFFAFVPLCDLLQLVDVFFGFGWG